MAKGFMKNILRFLSRSKKGPKATTRRGISPDATRPKGRRKVRIREDDDRKEGTSWSRLFKKANRPKTRTGRPKGRRGGHRQEVDPSDLEGDSSHETEDEETESDPPTAPPVDRSKFRPKTRRGPEEGPRPKGRRGEPRPEVNPADLTGDYTGTEPTSAQPNQERPPRSIWRRIDDWVEDRFKALTICLVIGIIIFQCHYVWLEFNGHAIADVRARNFNAEDKKYLLPSDQICIPNYEVFDMYISQPDNIDLVDPEERQMVIDSFKECNASMKIPNKMIRYARCIGRVSARLELDLSRVYHNMFNGDDLTRDHELFRLQEGSSRKDSPYFTTGFVDVGREVCLNFFTDSATTRYVKSGRGDDEGELFNPYVEDRINLYLIHKPTTVDFHYRIIVGSHNVRIGRTLESDLANVFTWYSGDQILSLRLRVSYDAIIEREAMNVWRNGKKTYIYPKCNEYSPNAPHVQTADGGDIYASLQCKLDPRVKCTDLTDCAELLDYLNPTGDCFLLSQVVRGISLHMLRSPLLVHRLVCSDDLPKEWLAERDAAKLISNATVCPPPCQTITHYMDVFVLRNVTLASGESVSSGGQTQTWFYQFFERNRNRAIWEVEYLIRMTVTQLCVHWASIVGIWSGLSFYVIVMYLKAKVVQRWHKRRAVNIQNQTNLYRPVGIVNNLNQNINQNRGNGGQNEGGPPPTQRPGSTNHWHRPEIQTISGDLQRQPSASSSLPSSSSISTDGGGIINQPTILDQSRHLHQTVNRHRITFAPQIHTLSDGQLPGNNRSTIIPISD